MTAKPISIEYLKAVCDTLCDVAMVLPRTVGSGRTPKDPMELNSLRQRVMNAADVIAYEIERRKSIPSEPQPALDWDDLKFISHVLFLRIDDIHNSANEKTAKTSREYAMRKKVEAVIKSMV